MGRLTEEDKITDFLFWDSLGDEAKFKAAWELVVQAHLVKGGELNELRCKRSVVQLTRRKC